MPFAETLFLAFVVIAFSGYGLLLFAAWLAVEVFDRRKPAKTTPSDKAAAVEAERPLRAA